MKTYIILGLLALFFIYMLVWTLKLGAYSKRQKKVRRIQELRAKGAEIKKRTIDCTKDYWYNLREIEDCKEGEDFEKYYHYFIGIDQGVEELLLEMYDCGIVRTDELEEIAYGKNHTRNVDLSFLEELEREMREESEGGSGMVLVSGVMGETGQDALVEASRKLREDDPGILDIYGTLSDGVVDVLEAAETEKKIRKEKEEPIIIKKEKSVEEMRKVRERTSNAEVRNKIYEKWVSYVFELYELININANEDTKHKIRKALMDYGYNDIDVLLESPE